MVYLGAHITSNPKYLLESTKRILESGGNLIQTFKNVSYKEFRYIIKVIYVMI